MAIKDYNLQLESLVTIFKAGEDVLKVLLIKNIDEPYKGYWVLPGTKVKNTDTIEDSIMNVIYDELGFKSLYIEQSHTYSNVSRNPENRVIAVNYIGLVDPITLLLKKEEKDSVEAEWFSITELPKVGFDHEDIINTSLEILSNKLRNVNYVKNLFPADFTLPEIEKVLSSINVNVDRRNFRKRLLKLDIIEETGEYYDGGNGRPAKLYRFKDNIKDINIF